MDIVEKDTAEIRGSAFQIGVIDVLDEYDYELLDLRYIEAVDQIIATIRGAVIFITPHELSISFEISSSPEFVSNLCLIFSEKIENSKINVTDSFVITLDPKGEKMAVFGSDAQDVYKRDLANDSYNSQYMRVLMSDKIKFHQC